MGLLAEAADRDALSRSEIGHLDRQATIGTVEFHPCLLSGGPLGKKPKAKKP
jgi:hypothetical protein